MREITTINLTYHELREAITSYIFAKTGRALPEDVSFTVENEPQLPGEGYTLAQPLPFARVTCSTSDIGEVLKQGQWVNVRDPRDSDRNPFQVRFGEKKDGIINYKTPDGEPLLPPAEFSAMRIEDNKERGFSECHFQRQTGRTTAMVLKALGFVKENATGDVVIEVHNQRMRKHVKELLLHYADEMGVGHRAQARIFTKTPSENISGIDIGLQLRDNVFDDTKENA